MHGKTSGMIRGVEQLLNRGAEFQEMANFCRIMSDIKKPKVTCSFVKKRAPSVQHGE